MQVLDFSISRLEWLRLVSNPRVPVRPLAVRSSYVGRPLEWWLWLWLGGEDRAGPRSILSPLKDDLETSNALDLDGSVSECRGLLRRGRSLLPSPL